MQSAIRASTHWHFAAGGERPSSRRAAILAHAARGADRRPIPATTEALTDESVQENSQKARNMAQPPPCGCHLNPLPFQKNKDSSTEQRGGRQTADLSKIMHWAEEQKNGISSFSYDMFRHPELQTSDSKEISPFLCIHLWGVCQHPSLSILLTHTAVS